MDICDFYGHVLVKEIKKGVDEVGVGFIKASKRVIRVGKGLVISKRLYNSGNGGVRRDFQL